MNRLLSLSVAVAVGLLTILLSCATNRNTEMTDQTRLKVIQKASASIERLDSAFHLMARSFESADSSDYLLIAQASKSIDSLDYFLDKIATDVMAKRPADSCIGELRVALAMLRRVDSTLFPLISDTVGGTHEFSQSTTTKDMMDRIDSYLVFLNDDSNGRTKDAQLEALLRGNRPPAGLLELGPLYGLIMTMMLGGLGILITILSIIVGSGFLRKQWSHKPAKGWPRIAPIEKIALAAWWLGTSLYFLLLPLATYYPTDPVSILTKYTAILGIGVFLSACQYAVALILRDTVTENRAL